MKAFIYTGGVVHTDRVTEHPRADDLRIAADSGYLTARALGDRVDIAVGDFDSMPADELPEGVEMIRVRAEKDDTDTQLAVEIAAERGADDIVIIGGMSGRLDHTLSSLYILEDLTLRGIYAVMTDGKNRARFLRSGSALIGRSGYKYISVIAADEKVRGVSIEGCRYPLRGATLERRRQYAVSNEIEGNCALISVKKGGIFIIESTDLK